MNKINIFSSLSVLAFLVACSSGGSTAPGGETLKAEVNEVDKTITTRSPSCEITATSAVFNPEGTVNTVHYELSGNKLIIDDETEFSGNNSSIYGTWTSSGPECTQMNMCEIVNISQTSVSHQIDVSKVCAFDYFSSEFSGMDEGVAAEVKKIDCSNGTATMGDLVITLKINEYSATKQSMTVSTADTSCTLITETKPLTEALCTVANKDKIEDDMYTTGNGDEFFGCYIGLIFGGMDLGDFDLGDFEMLTAKAQVKAFSKALSSLK